MPEADYMSMASNLKNKAKSEGYPNELPEHLFK